MRQTMKSTNINATWRLVCASGILLVVAGMAAAQTQPAMTLELTFQQSEQKLIESGSNLFGRYLGSGDGNVAGAVEGTVAWDLYEDQSRDDLHPAQFHGLLEVESGSYPFQLIGVYTPRQSERVTAPDGGEHVRFWELTGTIVFDDDRPLGTRQALVSGVTDLSAKRLRADVWIGKGNQSRP